MRNPNFRNDTRQVTPSRLHLSQSQSDSPSLSGLLIFRQPSPSQLNFGHLCGVLLLPTLHAHLPGAVTSTVSGTVTGTTVHQIAQPPICESTEKAFLKQPKVFLRKLGRGRGLERVETASGRTLGWDLRLPGRLLKVEP